MQSDAQRKHFDSLLKNQSFRLPFFMNCFTFFITHHYFTSRKTIFKSWTLFTAPDYRKRLIIIMNNPFTGWYDEMSRIRKTKIEIRLNFNLGPNLGDEKSHSRVAGTVTLFRSNWFDLLIKTETKTARDKEISSIPRNLFSFDARSGLKYWYCVYFYECSSIIIINKTILFLSAQWLRFLCPLLLSSPSKYLAVDDAKQQTYEMETRTE